MKKIKELEQRIEKIEKNYVKKPKVYHVILNNISEQEAINDLIKMGWQKTTIEYHFGTYTRLKKKEYENE